ncbi:MAG: AAA family ATPase, partial [Flavitalea sp.]
AMAEIIGRKEEIEQLNRAILSKEAELIAIYGRRRIGKTYLVRNYYSERIVFELSGMNNGTLKDQLLLFTKALQSTTNTPLALTAPASWVEAFTSLEQVLAKLSKKKKWVIFFDEFPWLNSRRSGFLEAFDHFWNSWASRQPNLVVVICGSAASWMIENIINAKGGLHNRITRSIRLLPFSLPETKSYLQSLFVDLDNYQVLQLYMSLGGVPYYLRNVDRGESATQAINRICFTQAGVLRNEFDNLYSSLFENSDTHIKIVKALSKTPKGMTRQEIIDQVGISSGGGASAILNELEQSGFIQSGIPYNKATKDAIYRLTDEYSLFYLKFIIGKKITGNDMWHKMSATSSYKIWCGMSFESVCLKHVHLIKKALGISGIHSEESPWRNPASKNSEGSQIDLLIDRADRTINICEMKFYNGEFTIDKAYASELERKLNVFGEQTKTKKSLFLTFITTYGIKKNEHAGRMVHIELSMDIFFK